MSDPARPPLRGQISPLPGTTTFLTGHDAKTGKSIVQSARPVPWSPFDSDKMGMGVVYTTTFPANLTNDTDISTHDKLLQSNTLGLVNPNGTVCRMVDLSPGYTCLMHRTQSLDYGIVLEGTVEMLLESDGNDDDDGDDGDRDGDGDNSSEAQQKNKKKVITMKRGDVAVQRATMHAWRNPSETEWARMIFVLQDCQKPVVQGREVGEDLGSGLEGLPDSGNKD